MTGPEIVALGVQIVGVTIVTFAVIFTVWPSTCRCLIFGHHWQAASWHIDHGTRRGDVDVCTRSCCRGTRRGTRHMHYDGTMHAGFHEDH